MADPVFAVYGMPEGGWVVAVDDRIIPAIFNTYAEAAETASYLDHKYSGDQKALLPTALKQRELVPA
jgi:hypothetical protein